MLITPHSFTKCSVEKLRVLSFWQGVTVSERWCIVLVSLFISMSVYTEATTSNRITLEERQTRHVIDAGSSYSSVPTLFPHWHGLSFHPAALEISAVSLEAASGTVCVLQLDHNIHLLKKNQNTANMRGVRGFLLMQWREKWDWNGSVSTIWDKWWGMKWRRELGAEVSKDNMKGQRRQFRHLEEFLLVPSSSCHCVTAKMKACVQLRYIYRSPVPEILTHLDF